MAAACNKKDPTLPCPHAIAAADTAVERVFAIIGVNIDDPEKVSQFQEELRTVRKVKRATDSSIRVILTTTITICVAYCLAKLGIIK